MARQGVKASLAELTAHILGPDDDTPAKPRVRGSGAVGAPTELAQFSVGYQELERKLEALEAGQGRALRVRLDLCDDGDHHASPVDPERVQVLKANMEQQGQTSPANVRAKPGGRYEVLAGRHRKYALLELGEEEWDVVLKDTPDEQAAKASFYDNLLAPNLPDYAKYRGFEKVKAENGMTFDELAKDAGVPPSTIKMLFVFAKLPPAAIAVVEKNPSAVGRGLVEALVPFLEKQEADVVSALEHLVANPKSTDAEILARLTRPTQQSPKAKAKPVLFRTGRKPYAELVAHNGRFVVTLKGQPEGEAKAIEAALTKVLRERADAAKE